MKPSVEMKTDSGSFTRLSSTAVYWEIKGLAVDHGLIVFCTSQLTRAAGQKKDLTTASAEDIAEDYNRVRICDAMLILVETIDMALQNTIGVKIGKNRDGFKPVELIMLLADKSRMRFYDPSPADVSGDDNKSTKNTIKKLKRDDNSLSSMLN
jgi:hypothetical protein